MNTVGGKYFDTYNTISAECDESLLHTAMDRCSIYNALLSKTVSGSDVWHINHAGGNSVTVHRDTMQILRCAAEIAVSSGGAFNIAVGAVVNLWKFTSADAHIPDPEQIAACIRAADPNQIHLDGLDVRVPAGMEIDLGGIAKGFIADRVADFLRESGVKHAILNFGGNVITIGSRPDGSPWTVGLQYPFREHGQKCWAALPSSDESIVTSGIYERGFNVDGIRYHHIIDPRTGWPVQNGVDCVTVCASNSMLADGLTTAMFVLGPQAGLRLANRYGVRGVYLGHDGKITFTAGLPLVLLDHSGE